MCDGGSEVSSTTGTWCLIDGCDEKAGLLREGPGQPATLKSRIIPNIDCKKEESHPQVRQPHEARVVEGGLVLEQRVDDPEYGTECARGSEIFRVPTVWQA